MNIDNLCSRLKKDPNTNFSWPLKVIWSVRLSVKIDRFISAGNFIGRRTPCESFMHPLGLHI